MVRLPDKGQTLEKILMSVGHVPDPFPESAFDTAYQRWSRPESDLETVPGPRPLAALDHRRQPKLSSTAGHTGCFSIL